jgi:chitosanase
MVQTCFPDEGLDGGNGHTRLDVLCKSLSHNTILTTPNVSNFLDILFGNQVPKGVGETTIDIEALRTLGDKQARSLVQALSS